MKYKSFIIISSLLCATNSFDMKYSLQKHEWDKHISKLVANDTIDDFAMLSYNRSTKDKVSLKTTDLAGRVTISQSYVLASEFKLHNIISSCLFSIERKDKQKLALCLEPAGEDAVTITLFSANIPGGKVGFGYKILKDKWIELIVAVNETGVSLLANCESHGRTQFNSKISKLIHLTDEMDMSIAFPLTSGQKFEVSIKSLDLYSPADATTITSLCPNFHSSQFRGENGEKGDKGDIGEKGDNGPKGDTGSKGEAGEYGVGHTGAPGLQGIKGDRGAPGMNGFDGVPGWPGEKGERGQKGSCECTEDVVSGLLSSMPQLTGHPGLQGPIGPPGKPGVIGLPGRKGEPGPQGPPSPASSASTDEHDALKAIASGMKLLTDHIIEKTEEIKRLTEHITKSNERIAIAEQNIEALKNAMLAESQM